MKLVCCNQEMRGTGRLLCPGASQRLAQYHFHGTIKARTVGDAATIFKLWKLRPRGIM